MTLFSRLAAYYPCDNTHGRSLSEDVVGTNDGTAGVVSAATGKVRQGMFFIASGEQFRSVPNDSAIQQLKGLCCWVKFSTIAADQSIVSKGSDATDANTSLKLWFDQSAGAFAYTVGDSSSSTTVTTSGLTIAVDTWYHVRCFNDGNRMGIAVNGTLYASGAARAPLTETGLLYLGRDFGGNYFDGVLDEVALFSTAPTVADGAALYNGGSGASLPLLDSLPGPSGRAGAGTRWLPPSYAESDDAVAYMAHGKLPVQRFDGTLATAGVEAPDQKVTIESSGSGPLVGKRYAYLRFLDSDGRVSNVSPLSDVHDTVGSASGSIIGATNASPIVITSASHGLTTGQTIGITGQQGNTAANGVWKITSLTVDTFSLDGSVGNGDWTMSAVPSMTVTATQDGSASVDQVQTLSYSNTPTTGSFTLSFEGESTTSIAYNASAATIQAALEAVSTIGESNVVCAGGDLPTAVTVTFQNVLGSQDNPLLEVDYTGATSTLSATVTRSGSPGQNEQQTISLLNTPTGGTFTLTYAGQTTGAIAYNASAATIDTALEALSNITSGDLTCTGGPLPGADVVVEFGGTLAETDVALMTINPASLTGGPGGVAIATTQAGGNALESATFESWSFEESTSDFVGSKSGHALESTGSNLISSNEGKSGRYVGFQSGVYLTLESGALASFPAPDGDWSINFWHQWDDVYSDHTVLSGNGWTFGTVYGPGNRYAKQFVIGATTAEWYTTAIPNGSTWVMTTLTVDGATKEMKLYISGSAVGDQVKTHVATLASSASYFYALFSGGGSIDELTVFNTVLTQGQIDELLNSGSGEFYPFPGVTGTNETQQITVSGSPSEGSFTLTFDGETTAAIDYDATAAEVDAALEALSNIAVGDVTCTGGPLPGTAIDVEFTGNQAATDVAEMTASSSGLLADVTTTQEGTGARNELVTLSTDVPPGTGTFTLTFGGQTTDNLNWNATAADVQSKLEALSTVGTGNVVCTGGPINTSDVRVEFKGTFSKTDVGAITASSSMTQTSPVMLVAETTAGDPGTNEIQQVSVEQVTGGTFTLTYSGQTTTAIAFDATAAKVEQELESLSTVGNGNVDVTGGPLTEAPLQVEFIGTLGKTDLSLMTSGSNSLLNGGWGAGASKITYTDVEIPESTRVVRRQILRSKPGDANVFYIDVDEEDVTSNTFSSTKTDDELTSDLAVVMLDSNGVDTNLSRHGEPPNWKRSVASFQNRMFYGVDYVERSVVTISGDAATGVATDWPNVFDDRTLYQDSGKALAAFDANAQTAALSESTATAQTAEKATIRQAAPDSQRIYHSWVNAVDSFPESVHPGQTFQISRDGRDGEMVGQFSFDGRFYVAFKSTIYLYSFDRDPTSAPDGDGRMQVVVPRGLCNHRTVAFTDDLAACMDHEGVYLFDGSALESVSGPIKPLFTGRSATKINWKHQEWFHAAYFSSERTIRFFVVLDGGPYPKHALCFNVDQRLWWLESYPWPITSSATGNLNGRVQTFVGSTGRRIFTLDGVRDGLSPLVADTLRGTVDSAGSRTLSDTSATWTSSMVGQSLRIVSGTGRGQSRDIVAVSGTTLTLGQRWNVRPSTDSVYQIAGVDWSIRTGKLRFVQQNEQELRRVEVFWTPTVNSQSLDYRLFADFEAVAVTNQETRSAAATDGVAVTAGSAYHEVDLTVRGHVEQDFGGLRPEGVSGEKFVELAAEGSTNDEAFRLLGIAVSGAE
jgi:hypothetical protein